MLISIMTYLTMFIIDTTQFSRVFDIILYFTNFDILRTQHYVLVGQ